MQMAAVVGAPRIETRRRARCLCVHPHLGGLRRPVPSCGAPWPAPGVPRPDGTRLDEQVMIDVDPERFEEMTAEALAGLPSAG